MDDPPSDYLTIDGLAPTVPWAQSKAARVVAMAAAIPCLAVRDTRKEDDDQSPQAVCEKLGLLEDEMRPISIASLPTRCLRTNDGLPSVGIKKTI